MALRKLPSLIGSKHALDRHLGFNSTAKVEWPHFLSSLSLQEKVQLGKSGQIPIACQALLDVFGAIDKTQELLVFLSKPTLPDVFAPLQRKRSERAAHESYWCEFVGDGDAYSFFNWRSPSTIQCNADGTSQIDWDAFCEDCGLDLSRWDWDCEDKKPVSRKTSCEFSLIAKYLSNTQNRSGDAVIDLLCCITFADLTAPEALHNHLVQCTEGSETTRHLLRPYINHGFVPSPPHQRFESIEAAVAGATHEFCESAATQSERDQNRARFQALCASPQPQELWLMDKELGALLRKHGALVLDTPEHSIWCRMDNQPARKDRVLEDVLIQEFPDWMDRAIRDALPATVKLLEQQHQEFLETSEI